MNFALTIKQQISYRCSFQHTAFASRALHHPQARLTVFCVGLEDLPKAHDDSLPAAQTCRSRDVIVKLFFIVLIWKMSYYNGTAKTTITDHKGNGRDA